MKRFTFESVHTKFLAASRIGTGVPTPFPGRYPTKIAFRMWFKDGGTRTYVGKPNQMVVRGLTKHLRNPEMTKYVMYEFDKTQIVERMGQYPGQQDYKFPVWMFYHPWRALSLVEGFSNPWFRKNIGGWVVYSPAATLKKQQVLDRKVWLYKNGYIKVNPVGGLPADIEKKPKKAPKTLIRWVTNCPSCGGSNTNSMYGVPQVNVTVECRGCGQIYRSTPAEGRIL